MPQVLVGADLAPGTSTGAPRFGVQLLAQAKALGRVNFHA